jgi:HEPN domain-containing protein
MKRTVSPRGSSDVATVALRRLEHACERLRDLSMITEQDRSELEKRYHSRRYVDAVRAATDDVQQDVEDARRLIAAVFPTAENGRTP